MQEVLYRQHSTQAVKRQGAAVKRYHQQSWQSDRERLDRRAYRILANLERQAEERGMASFVFPYEEGVSPRDVLVVIHASDVSWDYQPEDYKHGDFIYRIQFGRQPSEPLQGRNCAAIMLSLSRSIWEALR